jgi:hypothetical protein
MTEDEAFTVVGNIAVRTQGWDEPAVQAFVDDVMRYTPRFDLAQQAARDLCDAHTGAGRPMWATFKRCYLDVLHREAMNRPALPAASRAPVAPADYLTKLRNMAELDPDGIAVPKDAHGPAVTNAELLATFERRARLAVAPGPAGEPAWIGALR